MGVCLAKGKGAQSIEQSVIEPLEEQFHENAGSLRRNLTILKPPEALVRPISGTTADHLAESGDHSAEEVKSPNEVRGHLLVRISGSQSAGRQREFEEKQTTRIGDDVPADFLKTLGIASTCKKGLKPESPNQDDFCLMVHDVATILGVFDGHGPSGHQVSSYVSSKLPTALCSHESLLTNPPEAFVSTFYTIQQELVTRSPDGKRTFDCVYSGTTATVAVISEKKLSVGHVGDSRAVLSKVDPISGQRTAVQVTADHRPSLAGERERIESTGGEVKILVNDQAYRVFFPGKDFPGLAMSRALGDAISQQVGVISKPDTFESEISSEDEFILICSDGVWEFVSNIEAVETVGRLGKDRAAEAAEELAKLAWKAWVHHEGDVVDDITVVIAYLH